MTPAREFGIQQEGIEYSERVGSYGIALQGDNVLIEIGKLGYFLPGGGIDEGESSEAALQREFIEETGYLLRSWTFLGSAAEYRDVPEINFHQRKVGDFYLVELGEKGEPTYADGHMRPVEWLRLEDVQGKMHLESQWWAIQEALRTAG